MKNKLVEVRGIVGSVGSCVMLACLVVGAQTKRATAVADPGVVIQLKASQEHTAVGAPGSIELSVSNHTNELLQIPYGQDITTFRIVIHDQHGSVPRETMFGCRLHHSEACGHENNGLGGMGTAQPGSFFVAAGAEYKGQLDVGREYILGKGVAYTVSVEIDRASLVDAPAGVALAVVFKSPRRYLDTIRSNAVVIEQAP